VRPATDDWPFLYMRQPGIPRHYLAALAVVLTLSALAVWLARRDGGPAGVAGERDHDPGTTAWPADRGPNSEVVLARDGRLPAARKPLLRSPPGWSWHFFFLGAGFMLLETKSIVQFALLWGSTWSSASLAIASVLVMALASALVASRVEIRRHRAIAGALLALIALNYLIPVGRVTFDSRAAESLFYGLLVFSPVFCAGLLFSSSFKKSSSTADDFGANLLGAMVGGVGEYLSLLAGYRFLLAAVAVCYLAALAGSRMSARSLS
jgi:hypothetical protein